ncbi:MAG TPA: adenosine deaminase [Terriglobales bacterium]
MHSLAKVELHLHLDCSLSYNAVHALAPNVTRAEYEHSFAAPAKCANLAEFLSCAPSGIRLMQTQAALELAVEDLFEQLASDNVIYAEIRFAPLLHIECELTPDRVVAVVDRAVERMTAVSGIEARIILCALRHYTAAQSMQTAALVSRFKGSRVVALDLAADEAGFPIDAHVDAFRHAREAGCFTTAHAGEARGAESVWETLRELRPDRIGHGVRSLEDAALIEHLRASQTHLEVCPSANVQIIESIPEWREHPIHRLLKAGLSLNVNCDSRTLTPTNLNREYALLNEHFGWSSDEFYETNRMALNACFADSDTQNQLLAKLDLAYGRKDGAAREQVPQRTRS